MVIDQLLRPCTFIIRILFRTFPKFSVANLLVSAVGLLIVWNLILHSNVEVEKLELLRVRIEEVSTALERYNTAQLKLSSLMQSNRKLYPHPHIPVLVIACNRRSVSRPLNTLIKLKNEMLSYKASRFPIFVSHGCNDSPTADALSQYGDQISILRPDRPLFTTAGSRKIVSKVHAGYMHVAHHYKWALDEIFVKRNYNAAIVVEDDLDLAPDFLEYFTATYPLLNQDPTLFCISAFNDNGRPELIDSTKLDLLYRTDFFPGLGWMLLRQFWLEIRYNWPNIFWDEYLRQSWVRKNRSCVRPEISRSVTFGRIGISQGQYYDTHLKYIKLNEWKTPFSIYDLNYLKESAYNREWRALVYQQAVEISIQSLMDKKYPATQSIRVIYHNRTEFEKIAKHIHIMHDFKAGVCRNAYQGVVPIIWAGRRVFIAPPESWAGYNTSWV